MAHVSGERAIAPDGGPRKGRVVGLSLVAALLVSVMGLGAGSALARTCGTLTIGNGAASPGSGTTATTFNFSVKVTDTTGAAPESVRLRINGTWTDLSPNGSEFAAGVTYTGSRKLPV